MNPNKQHDDDFVYPNVSFPNNSMQSQGSWIRAAVSMHCTVTSEARLGGVCKKEELVLKNKGEVGTDARIS
jgi:hypothetical protein